MRIITEQPKTNPVLADVAIEAAKRQLLTLPWVDQAFGRVWPIPMQRGDKNVTEPCVYCNGNRYETLVPSADLGNYTFFVLMDSARYDEETDTYTQPYALVVWYDMNRCFENGSNRRDTENLKDDIIEVLRSTPISNGSIHVSRIIEMPKSVYKEFTFDTQQNQALVQPYGAIRFEGEITILKGCYQ